MQVELHEAEQHFADYVPLVKRGDTVVVCENHRPILEIRPVSPPTSQRRPVGLGKGLIDVPGDFNDPDPEIEAMFGNGRVFP